MTAPSPLAPGGLPAATLALIALVFLTTPAEAQGWDLELGVATVTEPVYPGADHSYVVPTVNFRASTHRGPWSWSASLLDGLDVTWFDPARGWLASLNVNQGDERRRDVYSIAGFEVDHRDETRRLLVGSPDLSNPVNATLMLGRLTPFGIVAASVAYHPTTVEATVDDDTHHGMLYSLSHLVSMPVGRRFAVMTLAQVEFMDDEYASAWYTAVESNASHGTFDARPGVRDVRFATQVSFAATERVTVSCVVAHTRLLGDAGASPYTTSRAQTAACLQALYQF